MDQEKTIEEMLKNEGITPDSPFYETVISVVDVQQAVESLIMQYGNYDILVTKLRDLIDILNGSFEIRSMLCKKNDFNIEVLEQAKENYIPRILNADKRIIEGINMLFRIPEENKEEAIEKLKEIASLGVKIDKFNFDKLNLGISNKRIKTKTEYEIKTVSDENEKIKYRHISPFMPPEVAYRTNEWLNQSHNEYTPKIIPIVGDYERNIGRVSRNNQNFYHIQSVPQTSSRNNQNNKTIKFVDRFKQNLKNKKRVSKKEMVKIVGVMSLAGLLALIAASNFDKGVETYAHRIVYTATQISSSPMAPTSTPTSTPTAAPADVSSLQYNSVKYASYVAGMPEDKLSWFTAELQKNKYLKPQNQTDREFVNEFYEDFFSIYKNGDENSCQLIAEKMSLFVKLDLKYEIANSLKNSNPNKYASLTPDNIEIDFFDGKYMVNAFGENICRKSFDAMSQFSKGMFGLYEVERLWVKKFNRNEGRAVGSRELDMALQNLGSYMQACESNGKLDYTHKYGFEFESDLKIKRDFDQNR